MPSSPSLPSITPRPTFFGIPSLRRDEGALQATKARWCWPKRSSGGRNVDVLVSRATVLRCASAHLAMSPVVQLLSVTSTSQVQHESMSQNRCGFLELVGADPNGALRWQNTDVLVARRQTCNACPHCCPRCVASGAAPLGDVHLARATRAVSTVRGNVHATSLGYLQVLGLVYEHSLNGMNRDESQPSRSPDPKKCVVKTNAILWSSIL